MKLRCASLLVIFCALTASRAHATLIHSDVMGDTVWFTNIEESSPTGDPLPLYGQPATNGDELIFPTTGNFSANSLDGLGSDQTDGKLGMMIEAKAGFVLNSIFIEENGLVSLNGPFGGDAYAEVVGFAVVKIAEILNVPVNLPGFNVFFNVSPLSGQYQLSTIGGSSFSSGWTGFGNIPLPENTTKVNVTLNNNLYAATLGSGTRAFLDKKAFEMDVVTEKIPDLIPEPASGVLALAGGLLMLARVVRFERANRVATVPMPPRR